jgi:VanZ family protein
VPSARSSSPFARSQRFSAFVALLLLASLLLAPGVGAGPDPWLGALFDLFHLPVFALVALCVAALLPTRLPVQRRAALAFALAVAFGAATEIAQGRLGRHPSLTDLALDAAGAGAAALWLLWQPNFSRRRLVALALILLAALLVAFAPPAVLTLGQARHQARFPEIGAFSEPSSRRVWRAQGKASLVWEQPGQAGESAALRVRIERGIYGGVSYWPGRQDWRKRESLVLEIDNPGPPFLLGLRIDDVETRSAADRGWHSDELHVGSGRRSYVVPLAPAARSGIDLRHVTRIALFTGEEETGREFLLHSAFLR